MDDAFILVLHCILLHKQFWPFRFNFITDKREQVAHFKRGSVSLSGHLDRNGFAVLEEELHAATTKFVKGSVSLESRPVPIVFYPNSRVKGTEEEVSLVMVGRARVRNHKFYL